MDIGLVSGLITILLFLYSVYKYFKRAISGWRQNKIKDKEIMIDLLPPSHNLDTIPAKIHLGKESGWFTLVVKSDTEWSIFVNQDTHFPIITNVEPLNGKGDMTVKVEYGGVKTQYFDESASLVLIYKSFGLSESKVVLISRRNLPR